LKSTSPAWSKDVVGSNDAGDHFYEPAERPFRLVHPREDLPTVPGTPKVVRQRVDQNRATSLQHRWCSMGGRRCEILRTCSSGSSLSASLRPASRGCRA
jgi:hypothetical protein